MGMLCLSQFLLDVSVYKLELEAQQAMLHKPDLTQSRMLRWQP